MANDYNNNKYYWINYDTVLEDLPILKINKKTLYSKHFFSLCNAKVLEHKHVKSGGSFSYYALSENAITILQNCKMETQKKENGGY